MYGSWVFYKLRKETIWLSARLKEVLALGKERSIGIRKEEFLSKFDQ